MEAPGLASCVLAEASCQFSTVFLTPPSCGLMTPEARGDGTVGLPSLSLLSDWVASSTE